VFRETLRLYPPITFLPRVANEATRIGDYPVKKVRRSWWPWAPHRHQAYWRDPHSFHPDRFLPEREAEMTAGAYISPSALVLGLRGCGFCAGGSGAADCTAVSALISTLKRLRRALCAVYYAPGAAGDVPRHPRGMTATAADVGACPRRWMWRADLLIRAGAWW
jgi:cytochrome P450